MSYEVLGQGASLADVLPSLLSGLGVPGTRNVLGVPRVRKACLLLVDGLGWQQLHEHASAAPFLREASEARDPIAAGFPSTTSTSITTLGTGLLSGEHGIVGYSFEVGHDVLNTLSWRRHADGRPVDLRARLVPEVIQPRQTMFERAAEHGLAVEIIAPGDHEGSGLTRAALRGAVFRRAFALGDLTSHILSSLRNHDRVLCYAYCADLDALGHGYGPESDAWVRQLGYVNDLVSTLAENLPEDSLLAVTADHGMVAVGDGDRVDFDTEPSLHQGVRQLAGEARVRHVYTEPGSAPHVARTWSKLLDDRAVVLTRDQAVRAGWFGPRTDPRVLPRIGDLVVAAQGTLAVVRSTVEPRLSRFAGQHGSLTAREQRVPFATWERRRP